MDAEELEPFADAGADRGRVLADPSGEDEDVESAERGGQRADRFLGVVDEHGDTASAARMSLS